MFSSCVFQVVTTSENVPTEDVLPADLNPAESSPSLRPCSEDIPQITIVKNIDFKYVFYEPSQNVATLNLKSQYIPDSSDSVNVPLVTISKNILTQDFLGTQVKSVESILASVGTGEDVPLVIIGNNVIARDVFP
ncbi:hypothetical protein, partial [Anabaenopsis elenkinii]